MDINQNLSTLMKKAQEVQQQMQDAQKELSELVEVGESGGGAVQFKMKGNHDAVKCKINNPALFEEDIEMLEDLIVAAVNDAVRKIEKASKEKISKLTAGLNIPTDFMKDKKEDEE